MSRLSVSVILITHNRADLVLRALNSVWPQIRPTDEVIVVDDGSSDGTDEVLSPFLDRIRYFKQDHAGQSAGMNFAFKKATKDLVALLDDDDEWMPGKLELQRRLLEARPDALYSFTSFVTVPQDGPECPGFLVNAEGPFGDWKAEHGPGVPFSSISELPEGQEDLQVFFGNEYEALMRADYMVGGLLVVRREAAGRHLHYPEDVRYCKDWECQAQLSSIGSAAYLDCDLYRWYEHPGARYADLEPFEKATCRLTILERMWGGDEAFLSKHGDEFQRKIDGQRNPRVRGFLLQGDVVSARKELGLIRSGSPLSFRFLALLPGALVKGILDARRFLRGLFRR